MAKEKCTWCLGDPLLESYHDTEWCVPQHDDRRLFELLLLESMSCGLSWLLILKKRAIIAQCFDDFDFDKIAAYDEQDIARILATPGMIRSRRKIAAMIVNAQRFIEVRRACGSFDHYLWHFTAGHVILYQQRLDGGWLTRSHLSDEVAHDLKQRGFQYVGSVIIYSYLQSVGIINDHDPHCSRWQEVMKGQQAEIRP